MKSILIILLIGCVNIEVKQRIVKNPIIDIYGRQDGRCNYTVEPRHNHRVTIIDTCLKYKIGDSLTRIERYTEK